MERVPSKLLWPVRVQVGSLAQGVATALRPPKRFVVVSTALTLFFSFALNAVDTLSRGLLRLKMMVVGLAVETTLLELSFACTVAEAFTVVLPLSPNNLLLCT